MLKTLAKLRAIDIGFRPDHLCSHAHHPAARPYQIPGRRAWRSSTACWKACSALPGVEGAAYNSVLPFQSTGNTQGYSVEGRELPPGEAGDALLASAPTDYLKTLGVQLVEGRASGFAATSRSAAGDRYQRDLRAALLDHTRAPSGIASH